MQKITGINMPLEHTLEDVEKKALQLCGQTAGRVRILKKSVDARRRKVQFVYTVLVYAEEERAEDEGLLQVPRIRTEKPPVVVGCGPAGLFAGYVLALAGCRPVILERGKEVSERKKDVDLFWETGQFCPESNVQFGEGGAGTFSDGKLTTQISSPLCREVIRLFLACGAPEEIAYLARPHIGTDLLIGVVQRLRRKIEQLGGTVLFQECMQDICFQNGKVTGVVGSRLYETDAVILAIGHSARDTVGMLYEKGLEMTPKAFSLGVRIEHPQKMIDISQYGEFAGHPALPPAEYKLSCHTAKGRGVYTFCMCPGGVVAAASSEAGGVVTNGMSYHKRDGENANAALLVGVQPSDFENAHPLAGISLQRRLEQAAFAAGGRDYRAPAQYVGDFLSLSARRREEVIPTYPIGIKELDLKAILPAYVTQAMQEALPVLDRKMKGFSMPGAVMTGVETRSSSPVRIVRNRELMGSLAGIFPAGEGAGYAGGIMSSAVDGIRCALAAISYLQENKRK